MPDYLPDPDQAASPVVKELAKGLVLWRFHSENYGAAEFKSTIPGPKVGGRVDSHDGSFAYLYAGSDSVAAVVEALLRNRPHSPRVYQIPRVRLRGKRLSKIELAFDLTVVKLHGDGLAAIGQDVWLTSCGPPDYPTTRLWADTIRGWEPTACGLEWRPRHDNDRFAYVFFEDRCRAGSFVAVKTYAVDTPGRGFTLVQLAAQKHNALAEL